MMRRDIPATSGMAHGFLTPPLAGYAHASLTVSLQLRRLLEFAAPSTENLVAHAAVAMLAEKTIR